MSITLGDLGRDRGGDVAVCASCQHEQSPRKFCFYCGQPFVALRLQALPPLPAAGLARLNFAGLPYTGPSDPQPGVTRPGAIEEMLGKGVARADARLTWVGVGMGSGESVMESLLPGSVAGGHVWPCLGPDDTQNLSSEVPTVLLVPLNLANLALAQTVARQWASGDVEPVRLLGLVFVPTNGKRIPKALRTAAGIVAGGVPRTWWMPWLASLHSPKKAPLPQAAQKVLADLTTLTSKI